MTLPGGEKYQKYEYFEKNLGYFYLMSVRRCQLKHFEDLFARFRLQQYN